MWLCSAVTCVAWRAQVRAYNSQIPDNWKELAGAGLYEWRALMEGAGVDGSAGGGGGGYTPEGGYDGAGRDS